MVITENGAPVSRAVARTLSTFTSIRFHLVCSVNRVLSVSPIDAVPSTGATTLFFIAGHRGKVVCGAEENGIDDVGVTERESSRNHSQVPGGISDLGWLRGNKQNGH